MDPSQENQHDTAPAIKKNVFIPTLLVVLLLLTIIGLGFFFYSDSLPIALRSTNAPTPEINSPVPSLTSTDPTPEAIKKTSKESIASKQITLSQSTASPAAPKESPAPPKESQTVAQTDVTEPVSQQNLSPSAATTSTTIPANPPAKSVESTCKAPEKRLRNFYNLLDKQPYMSQYQLTSSSEQHITALIHKLLNNPPQVTRESDDLYTILKNTAHFFRVSGKDNVLMMKGILGNEKEHIEQILADYNQLITTPECSTSPLITGMDQEALYEYACFFLNTMGGRLYLFRRDSLSRMVVTYYAILLIDRANQENNNRHGLDLKSFVDMLIAEMESGGSSLKFQDRYLDSLYLMKEKYQ